VRSTALRVRNEPYVEAARCMGCGTGRILLRHILPNCFVPVLVQASMDFGYVVLAAASLSFIGLGAQPPAPEWGLMVNNGRRFFPQWWWLVTFPGLAIFAAVLSFNLFGDGLREVLDPRMNKD
jgi:peptide/nickel transport system permease protein